MNVISAQKTATKFDPDQTFGGQAVGCLRSLSDSSLAINLAFPEVGRMSVAARTIIELNIKHYRDLLRSETNAARGETIAKLLAEEEANWLSSWPRNAMTSDFRAQLTTLSPA